MIKVIMKCQDCNWVCITDVFENKDWEKLDIANWNKSKHVSNFQHTVIIKQEKDFIIRRVEKK